MSDLGKPGTPDGPPAGSFLVEGHWRFDKNGKPHWVEPSVGNIVEAAEAIAGLLELEEEPCDICGGTHVGLCPDDPSEKEEL